MSEADADFEEHRAELHRLAYQLLGSLSDADDVLQEAYLRWSRDERAAIQSPRAYLRAIVTRLCIDQHRQIDARKASYVGPWLPEPLIESPTVDHAELAESISLAFLVVLETLSPTERAAYVLRRLFEYDYDELSEILGKSETACRQLVSRAEERIRAGRPRFDPQPEQAQQITNLFLQACATGDLNGLKQLLAADAVSYSDGGGKVAAALAPIRGADRIARFLLGVLKKAPASLRHVPIFVNGQPGLMTLDGDQPVGVLTLEIVDGRIQNCFIIRNPTKLTQAVRLVAQSRPE